jgi:Protein of unknown function (DUF2505)
MKLDVRHAYDCTPERFWQMYWDDGFDAMLRSSSGVTRELIAERTEGDVVIRRLRFVPDRELPGAVASILGSKKLVYEQENRWDRARSTLHWQVLPSFLPGKLSAAGQFVVQATPSGCEQLITGEIKVSVPLMGGQIERAIVGEIEGSYLKTAAAGREWLRNNVA